MITTCDRKWLLLLFTIFCVILNRFTFANTIIEPHSDEAYVTLLYGDFLLGVRVLGQSLKETGTKRDLVVIATNDLSSHSEATLTLDGWKVKRVRAILNPGKGPLVGGGYPKRFYAVYTKLYIFQMTEYKRVVFLDADILVMRNMDALFHCPGFCAALRHSEHFNSGVMSVAPSQEVFDDMMRNIDKMTSYTGGDQGFLNAYLKGFSSGDLFDPSTSYTLAEHKYMRLPTVYNADVGLCIANGNRWVLPVETIYAIHFTFGPFKPWAWWTSWWVRETPRWQAVRYRLPPDANGYTHGRSFKHSLAQWVLLPLPMVVAAVMLARLLRHRGAMRRIKHHPSDARLPIDGHAFPSGPHRHDNLSSWLVPISVLAGYASIAVALLVLILLVPLTCPPVLGWVLTYEWGLGIFGLAYGRYLCLCYQWGRVSRNPMLSGVSYSRAHSLLVRDSAFALSTFSMLLILAPSVGQLLGYFSQQARLTAAIVCVMIAVVYATVQFVLLPVKWFLAGHYDGGSWR